MKFSAIKLEGRRRMRVILTAAVLLLVACFNAWAGPPGTVPVENYPGWDAKHRGFHNVAFFLVGAGVKQFYKLHGRWPATWVEVRQQGIFQVNLIGFDGQIIDPDDGACSTIGDVQYRRSADGSKALITILDGRGRPEFHTYDQNSVPATYARIFQVADSKHRTKWFTITGADKMRLRSYALVGMIRKSLLLYEMVHGDYPKTWNQFVESRLSPVDLGAVNPASLKTIDGKGGPNDIEYRYYPPKGQKRSSFSIHLRGPDGKKEAYGFTP
jgi:hypothetical protein